MTRLIPMALVVVACAPEGPTPLLPPAGDAAWETPITTTAPAPPAMIDLEIPRLFAGHDAWLDLDGMQPWSEVVVAAGMGAVPSAWCPAPLNGTCLDLQAPARPIAHGLAWSQGEARLETRPPKVSVGQRFCLQAVAPQGGPLSTLIVSDAICTTVLDSTADRDHDSIPDHADPFPEDAQRPGWFDPEAVLAQSASTLYWFDTAGTEVLPLAQFSFEQGTSADILDIALDRYGVLYATTGHETFTCHPRTGACSLVGSWQDGPGGAIVGDGLFGFAGMARSPSHDGLISVWPDSIARHGLPDQDMQSEPDSWLEEWTLGGDGVQSPSGAVHVLGRDALHPEDGQVLLELDREVVGGAHTRAVLPDGVEFTGLAARDHRNFLAFASDGSIWRIDRELWTVAHLADTEVAFEGAASGPRTD